ncbi:MAG: amidohydrolase/deacetylase family metallohydrolase [Proteobacteria bacterium]|jgi:dihydroorotase|nr:amidohydrolase/deacetylase family metallohydrolase [Pseudomonadota bacterium]
MATYDLVVRGGEVIDPATGTRGHLDVGILNGRIAAVSPSIAPGDARESFDATGHLVTPGLIDYHVHVYHGATYWGIDPDPVAWRTGVTTWVDAGSAGATTWPAFRDWCVRPARSRILAFLNIATAGLASATHELASLDNLDVDLCIRTIEANRGHLIGVKVRMGSPDVNPHGLEPLHRALGAAQAVGLPVMVHLGAAPPAIEEIVARLRPGDSITHAFNGNTMRMVDDHGTIRPEVARAWDRGMIVDIGHGAGGFSFLTAEALLAQGRPPDIISTDLHQLAVNGPAFDLPTVMSKFLALGMDVEAVVARATAAPAKALGRDDLGTLRPGAIADVAVFALDHGDHAFYDVRGNRRDGTARLRNVATFVAGSRLPEMAPAQPALWMAPSELQRQVAAAGHVPAGYRWPFGA